MNRIKLATSALFLFAAIVTTSSAQINGGTIGTTRPVLPKVTYVSISALGTGGSGNDCPKGAMVTAGITTDGPCTVQYQWVYSWKEPGPVTSLTFTKAESKTQSIGLTLATNENPSFNGWIKLKVISPNTMESPQQNLSASCSGYSIPSGGIIIKP
jgi:hypothetical protein